MSLSQVTMPSVTIEQVSPVGQVKAFDKNAEWRLEKFRMRTDSGEATARMKIKAGKDE